MPHDALRRPGRRPVCPVCLGGGLVDPPSGHPRDYRDLILCTACGGAGKRPPNTSRPCTPKQQTPPPGLKAFIERG